jgi:hypothetical protein
MEQLCKRNKRQKRTVRIFIVRTTTTTTFVVIVVIVVIITSIDLNQSMLYMQRCHDGSYMQRCHDGSQYIRRHAEWVHVAFAVTVTVTAASKPQSSSICHRVGRVVADIIARTDGNGILSGIHKRRCRTTTERVFTYGTLCDTQRNDDRVATAIAVAVT